MVDSQPGTVTAFDPSLTLSNFSAETRDRFLHNANQLVLAKLQQARPTTAVARIRTGAYDFVEFSEYRNLSGGLALIDGTYQALETTGAPTAPYQQLLVGFDQQVTTDTIIFWSTDYVDTSKIIVQYSYDNETWFSVGTVSWVQFFDDTIEVFPGDVPPTGEYRYTGTIGAGNITARYWKLRADPTTSYTSLSGTNPNKTLYVASTADFASSGTLQLLLGTTARLVTYTGKTAGTFTGVNDVYDTYKTLSIDYITGDNPDITLVAYGSAGDGFPAENGWVQLDAEVAGYIDGALFYTTRVVDGLNVTFYGCTIVPGPDDVYYNSSTLDYYTLREKLNAGGYSSIYSLHYHPAALAPGVVVCARNSLGQGITEIQIVGSQTPLLQHWNSDGSQAVTNVVEGSDYYDIAYDVADDVYYALRFNDDLAGSVVIDPDDDFSVGVDSAFDTIKWVESPTNVYFQRNSVSGTLEQKSSGGAGQLTSTYGIDGNFVADIDLASVLELRDKAYFSLEMADYSTGNVHLMSMLRGDYVPGSGTAGNFCGATMTYSDTVGSAAVLSDFRIDPTTLDFGYAVPPSSLTYEMLYDEAAGVYNVTASGAVYPVAAPGSLYEASGVSFTISNVTSPADGQGFTVLVWTAQDSINGTSTSGISLQIERAGTNGYARYADSDTPGVYEQSLVANVPDTRMKLRLYGDPNSQSINLAADNFTVTGGTVYYDTPVFSVVTVDKSGNLVQVASISDADGYVIKAFDVIKDPQAVYNRYLAPRAAIATNGLARAAGGEIYLKIDDILYRYVKTAFPLTTEDGATATTMTSGVIPATGVTNFAYNGFSGGGLSYLKYEVDLGGVFVKSISSSTLEAEPLKAWVDVASISYPFAWNVSDLSTLYYVDGTALYLYDLNESKAGFVNVTSDKQVLAAGTAETATITAQVLNVYGQPKSAKSMTFSVSAGDGALSPATGCSDVNGEDTSTYTVGAAVGTATITVTVSDVTCVP